MISVDTLTDADSKEYNRFLERCPDTHLYHTLQWKVILERSFKWQAEFLIAKKDDAIVDVLPLFLIQHPVLGKKLVSLPLSLGCYNAFLSNDSEVKNQLIAKAIALAKAKKVKYVEVRTNQSNKEFIDNGFVEKKPLVFPVLELLSTEQNKKKMSKGHRASLNFIRKNKVTVRETKNTDDLKLFFEILADSYQNFGSPMFGSVFLDNMWNILQEEDALTLLRVDHEGAMIGGGLFLRYNNVLSYKYGACLKDKLHLRPFQALIWHAIQMGLEKGCHHLDLGATGTAEGGLLGFKKHFGSDIKPAYFYYLPVTGDFPDLEGYLSSYTLAKTIWRKLPKRVIATIGPQIVKWVA